MLTSLQLPSPCSPAARHRAAIRYTRKPKSVLANLPNRFAAIRSFFCLCRSKVPEKTFFSWNTSVLLGKGENAANPLRGTGPKRKERLQYMQLRIYLKEYCTVLYCYRVRRGFERDVSRADCRAWQCCQVSFAADDWETAAEDEKKKRFQIPTRMTLLLTCITGPIVKSQQSDLQGLKGECLEG